MTLVCPCAQVVSQCNSVQTMGNVQAGFLRHGVWQEGLLSGEKICVSFHEVDALGGGGKLASHCQGQHPLSKEVKGSKLMHFGWKN